MNSKLHGLQYQTTIMLTLYRVRFDLLSEDEKNVMAYNAESINILAPNVETAIELAQKIAPTMRRQAVHKNLHVADVVVKRTGVYVDVGAVIEQGIDNAGDR